MTTIFFESSLDYEANINYWCDKFSMLMKKEINAAVAIVGFYLPYSCDMLGCPLGDSEFEKLGVEMKSNPAMFTAAEKSGMLVEAVIAIFRDAFTTCDNWAYHKDNIQYILENDTLSKLVPFDDRYMAECLLSGGELLCKDEDAWEKIATQVDDTLRSRSRRGYN